MQNNVLVGRIKTYIGQLCARHDTHELCIDIERASFGSDNEELISEMKRRTRKCEPLEQKLADIRWGLRDVEDGHRNIEESLRSETRETIEQIKNHVW